MVWSDGFWPSIGGVQVLNVHLLRGLQERGYEFVVVTSRDQPRWPARSDYHGIPIMRLPFSRAIMNQDLREMRQLTEAARDLAATFQPDLVHVNYPGPSLFYYLKVQATARARSLIAIHALTTHTIEPNSMQARVLQQASWVVAVSQAMLADVRALVPEVAGRSSVVYNGLYPPDAAPEPIRFDPPRLLCLGRLVAEKGFDLAIRALPAVLGRHPTARLIVAGDGPARAELESLAAELGLSGCVDFLGWVAPEKVPNLINTVTLVIMPSRWREPFGLVALQAAQMGRPIVAARVGGLPEIVQDGQTGWLVESENSAALAERLIQVLDSAERAAEAGAAARRHALGRFSIERCVAEYDALYQQLGLLPAT